MIYTLEHYLMTLHTGQWFGWSDSKNKVYANLVIHSSDAKPSEADCNAGVAAMQAAYDAKAYARNRVAEYPSIGDQLDALYHAGTFDATMTAAIKAVKDKYPKE
jgi:hypothetical protein